METAFHYNVKVKLFNYHNKDKVEHIEYFQEFRDNNPIKARIAAFHYYQNMIEGLLEANQKNYISDRQAREDLKIYLTPSTATKLIVGGKNVDLSKSVSIGIGVYFVIDTPQKAIYKNDTINDHVGDEDLIHGIGNSGNFYDPSDLAFNLENELEYYLENNYDFGDYKRSASCFNHIVQKVEEFDFLETPFDWTGLDDPTHPLLHLVVKKDYTTIIENGEGKTVEFKSALSYHFANKTWEGRAIVNRNIARAMCSFLNSDGGLLFVGIRDDGEVQGLNFDFRLYEKENKKDAFKCDFDGIIERYLGFSAIQFINGNFVDIDGKTIFVVEVEPCRRKPIFLRTNDDENTKEFYIRGHASGRRINDIEEIINYWLERKEHYFSITDGRIQPLSR